MHRRTDESGVPDVTMLDHAECQGYWTEFHQCFVMMPTLQAQWHSQSLIGAEKVHQFQRMSDKQGLLCEPHSRLGSPAQLVLAGHIYEVLMSRWCFVPVRSD